VNPRLESLHAYPFERLRKLLENVPAAKDRTPLNLGIGEPQHETPSVVTEALRQNFHLLGKYPPTLGTPTFREAVAKWLFKRYGLSLNEPETSILPVSGSREALFGIAQAAIDPKDPGYVLLPNPFYQIYEGAALLAGSIPFYVPTPEATGYMPDWTAVPADIWPNVKLAYVCSPGNPTGAVLGMEHWKTIFDLAEKYGFIVASDECYSEIYQGDPPIGAFQAAHHLGRTVDRLVVFNSLSKRSSSPGLRSGFAAGCPATIEKYLLYRTYQGAAPSLLTLAAAEAAWQDEVHVEENRQLYRAKFEAAKASIPNVRIPDGAFFLWLPASNDEKTAQGIYRDFGLTVLPGTYLGRDGVGGNPGANYIRIALVPSLEKCHQALQSIRTYLESNHDRS
jgi:N-succinyldiaminopimelate aminotransferase